MREDDDLIRTVDQWTQQEQANRVKEIRLAHERAEKRWADFKTGILWVLKIVFFPITIFVKIHNSSKDIFWLVVLVLGILFTCVLTCMNMPSLQEDFALCVEKADADLCQSLMDACPETRDTRIDQCRTNCECVRTNRVGACKEREAKCWDQCRKVPEFNEEDLLLAECSQVMGLQPCTSLFRHCGNLYH